jgi:hypothetical protein
MGPHKSCKEQPGISILKIMKTATFMYMSIAMAKALLLRKGTG